MRRTKDKQIYRVQNNCTLKNLGCKVIKGDDFNKFKRFLKILKSIIKKENPYGGLVGLHPIYLGNGMSVTFHYFKDYDYFVNKALKQYYQT